MLDLLQVAQREDKALWVPLTLSDQEQAVHQALLPNEPLALLSRNASMEPGLGAVDGCTKARTRAWGGQAETMVLMQMGAGPSPSRPGPPPELHSELPGGSQ